MCYNPLCQSGGCIAVFSSDDDRPVGVSGGAFVVVSDRREMTDPGEKLPSWPDLEYWRTRAETMEATAASLRHELRIARRAIAELFRQVSVTAMAEADKADEVQAHVDAVLRDLAQDRLKPQQIEQVQRGITDASLRRAVRGQVWR